MLPIRLPPFLSRLKAKLARWLQSCWDLYIDMRGDSCRARSGLHRHFEQYRRGHKRQRSSARINDRIAIALAEDKRELSFGP
jgi:hypothetical protein